MPNNFSLFLFTVNCNLALLAAHAGVDGIIIDWEHIGKFDRQKGVDTQINHDTPEDLARVRACVGPAARILCRVNPPGPWTRGEIEQAASAGADEILLPMVRRPAEVEQALEWARGRLGVGILVETVGALNCLDALARLPLTRVYLGLNDLWIERRTPNLFTAIIDGTVERVRAAFDAPFGFAGLTLPDCGTPIPCRLLIGEMARLRCNFSFLRRSFLRDVTGHDLNYEVPRMRAALREAAARSTEETAADHAALAREIAAWEPA